MEPSDQLDATWLASRRWFRSKARPLRLVAVHDQATLPDGGVLLILDAAFADGGHERYTVPAWPDGDGYREPADGDGLWRGLVAVMADGGRQLEAQRGSFDLAPGPALEGLLPGGRAAAEALTERSLGVEQSNTSIRLGDRLMLKVYRLLEPGINPELEVTEFLTAAGFGHAPLAAGAAHYQPHDGDDEPAAVAIVQSQVPARGDAWGWMVERLGAPPTGPIEGLAAAAEIGGVTAELHDALQSEPDRPDFPSRAATAEELAAWQASAEEQLDAAIAALDGEDRGRLAALAPNARRVLGAIGKAPMAWVSRIHGDYHLGQLLATDEGFVVTDFEGEPARPLAERRRPSSPLRDVAGMLRSLDYAARSAERARSDFEPDPWLSDARAALLNAYGGSADPSLLAAFELEKACYEIRYEANFRPDWVPLPLGAVERLVA